METLESDSQTLKEVETNPKQEVSRVSGSSGPNTVQTGSGLHSEVPGAVLKDEYVSVSKNVGNRVVVTSQMAKTEISVEKSGENGIGDISVAEIASSRDGGKNGGNGRDAVEGSSIVDKRIVDQGNMTGGSLEEHRENGDKDVIGCVSAANEDEKDEVEKILVDGKVFHGVDLGRKIEVSGDNIPPGLEVHGNLAGGAQDSGSKGVEMASEENPILDREVEERTNGLAGNEPDSALEMTRNGTVEDVEEKQVDGQGEEDEGEGEGEEEEMDGQEDKFLVGDFVWGKIKSHPWWPGQIYDPSAASKIAARYQRRDSYLVAYFGDGTFAWCHPSQLKPFQENFETMAKQSTSKSFLKAVEEAVDEIGRRVELEMTCYCVAAEIPTRLIAPYAVNAGIKEGVAVPEGGIGELSIARYEPAKFLARLQYIAQVVSVTSMLELTVFQSQLSAFYRAKGYSQLPMYHEPMGITDPLDNRGNGIAGPGDFEGQTVDLTASPAEEDWLSSPISSRRNNLTLSQKWAKLYHRKKQRSMAELLAKDIDVQAAENHVNDVAEEGAVSGKPKLASRKRKKNKDSKAGNDSEAAEEGLGGSKSSPPSKKWKKTKDIGTERGSKSGPVLRERKKSKYLSPPYTNIRRGRSSLISMKDSEIEAPNVPKVSTVGECIIKAAGQLAWSAPIVKCGETVQKKRSKKSHVEPNTSVSLSPRTPKEDGHKIVIEEGNASARKMLLDFRSAAMDPLYLKEKHSDTIRFFFTRLRSSLYRNGSDFVIYNKYLSGRGSRKRVSLDAKLVSPGNTHENDHLMAKGKSEQRTRKRKGDAVLRSPKKKSNSNHDGEIEGETSAAVLLLTFAPGASLPSKDDLVTMFSKFGALNESQTEVLEDSDCAKVVYTRCSDAEEAYRSSVNINPYGPAVSYRLRYLSAAAKDLEHHEKSRHGQLATHSPMKEGYAPAYQSATPPPFHKVPSFVNVTKNLKTAASVLEKSWDKLSPEVKASLGGEVKGLLNKVTSMAELYST